MAVSPKAGISLRAATVDDSRVMLELIQAMASEMGRSEDVCSRSGDFSQFGFSDPPSFHALIAERDTIVLGLCLYLYTYSSWRGTRGVYVQDIYVTKSERGSGVALQLIAETARISAMQGAGFLRLSVDPDNLRARKFYESMGLKLAEKECIYMALGDEFEVLKNTPKQFL